MLTIIALMRDWLLMAGSDELFDHYCSYTADDVLRAIEEMYPGGCAGWLSEAWKHGGMPATTASTVGG